MKSLATPLKQTGIAIVGMALLATSVLATAGNKVKDLKFREASPFPVAVIKIKNDGRRYTKVVSSKATFRVNIFAKCATSYGLKSAGVSPTKFAISGGISEYSPGQYVKRIDPRGMPRKIDWKNINIDLAVNKLYSSTGPVKLCNNLLNAASNKAAFLKTEHSFTKQRSLYLAVYCSHKKKNKGSHRQYHRPMPVKFICMKK